MKMMAGKRARKKLKAREEALVVNEPLDRPLKKSTNTANNGSPSKPGRVTLLEKSRA